MNKVFPKPLISIVTPVYNEENNLPNYESRIVQLMDECSAYDFEVVITDNSSSDGSFSYLKEWAARDPRVRAYRLSRNFGYQRSIFTGYRLTRGQAAVELDADLQDPPEMVKAFLEKWREGYKIIYGIREKRVEGYFITRGRRIYYRVLRYLSENDLPTDAGDFMLIDREVLNHLVCIREPNLYIRGIIFGFGFRRVGIPYARLARHSGKTKFSVRKLGELALDGIIGSSVVPLRFASMVGLTIAVLTFLMSLIYIIVQLTVGIPAPLGFTTLVVLTLLSASMNAIFLGIVGEYIARIYNQTKIRPMAIIEEATDDAII